MSADASRLPSAAPGKVELRGVTKAFVDEKRGRRTVALENVSLSIPDGQFVCLLGPSGCGKTTVLNMVAGFERASEGEILVESRPVDKPGRDYGMVFQQPHLFPWLTVLENITFGPRLTGTPEREYLPQANRYVERMGLRGFEQHYPYELSGGMQQRVAVARALVMQPPLVLADEPTGNLDRASSDEVFALMRRMHAEFKTSFLVVTHDPRLAQRCDRVIELVDGRIERDERSA